jgi:raffinose/stachyose/melibiose transport system substrate-binding protein
VASHLAPFRYRRLIAPIAVLGAVTAALAGCTGTPTVAVKQPTAKAGSIPTLAAAMAQLRKSGPLTLNVLDQEGPVSSGGSGSKEVTTLNAAFEKAFPNVTIHRSTETLQALTTQLPLLLSTSHAPDVSESDQGYTTQGRLVKAGLLLPLNGYAKAWGWYHLQSPGTLVGQRVLTDGTHLGSGDLYGVAMSRSVVSIYYNAKLLRQLHLGVPTTKAQFENALAKAKAAGIIPLMGADGDHQLTDWGLMLAMEMNVPVAQLRTAYLGQKGASFATPAMTAAISEFRSWGTKGYFAPGYGGLTSDVAAGRFSKGQGLFFVNGSWWASGVAAGLGANGRMMLPPVGPDGKPALIAAANQPWVIPTNSKHKLAAALYINFLISAANTKVFLGDSDIPASKFNPSQGANNPLAQDILHIATVADQDNTGLPFFWAVPNVQQFQEGPGAALAAGRMSVATFEAGMNAALKQDQETYQ